MSFFEEKDGCLILNVRVIPRATKNEIVGLMGDALKIRVQAPPVEGKANAHLVKLLSKQWGISRANIELLSGETGRNKRLCITNPPDDLRKVLLSYGNE